MLDIDSISIVNHTAFSVIVPVFNAEKTINRCVASLKAQTFNDFELLLVDDGSTDKSGRICDELAAEDKRIKVFHCKNGGASSARNIGLNEAKGRWIAFVDADDWVEPTFLEYYTTRVTPEVHLVVQSFSIVGSSGRETEARLWDNFDYEGNPQNGLIHLSRYIMIGSVCNKAFQRDIIVKHNIRFKENFVFREDEDFVLNYMRYVERIVCTDTATYHYDMPDLSVKYKHTDNFFCSAAMLASIRSIFGEKVHPLCARYLQDCNNAFFYSFDSKIKGRKDRIAVYRNAVGPWIAHSQISIFSKWVLCYVKPDGLASFLLDLKSLVKRARSTAR